MYCCSANERPSEDPSQSLDAIYNYWGHKIEVDNIPLTVSARIHDYRDDYNLSQVRYEPFYASNFSILDGDAETGMP